MSWLITGSEKNPTDPFRSQVSLLLHGDGTNGSTTITDSSPSPKTVTAFGDAKISTVQSKFGGSSLAFDGTGDYLAASSSELAFGSGDFTVECWARFTTLGDQNVVATRRAPANANAWSFAMSSGTIVTSIAQGKLYFYTDDIIATTSISLAANTWYNLAVSRQGTSLRIFVDGTQQGSATNSQNLSVPNLAVGNAVAGVQFPLNGYIDDLRITKGVARYTANFTPPTAPFPDI